MDFSKLRYLVTVAALGNVTRAADVLHISQSALSHYIRNAEKEFGVRLFDRSTTPMTLTPAGERYIEYAQRTLLEDERLRKELRDITRHMTGKLRVGTSINRVSSMMPRLLPFLHERYPGITFEVLTESSQKLKDALRSGKADLLLLPETVTWGPEEDGDKRWLRAETVCREELVFAARSGAVPDPERQGSQNVIGTKALREMPFFLLFQEHASRTFCDAFFKRRRIRPRIKMELSSSIACYRMAAAGLGVTIVPYQITRMTNAFDDGSEGVELFSLGDPPETWDIQVFYRKDAYLGEPERYLIETARQVFAQETLLKNKI